MEFGNKIRTLDLSSPLESQTAWKELKKIALPEDTSDLSDLIRETINTAVSQHSLLNAGLILELAHEKSLPIEVGPYDQILSELRYVLPSITTHIKQHQEDIADNMLSEFIHKHDTLFQKPDYQPLVHSLLISIANSTGRLVYLKRSLHQFEKMCVDLSNPRILLPNYFSNNDQILYAHLYNALLSKHSTEAVKKQLHDLIPESKYIYSWLSVACGHGLKLLAIYLLTEAPKHEQNTEKYLSGFYLYHVPLATAAENGHIEVVKYLLTQAPGREQVVAHITDGNNRALHRAAQNGHIEVVKYLLTQAPGHKKVVQHIADYSNEALREAASNGHIEVVKYLLTQAPGHKKVVQHIADYSNEALREAASNGHIEVVKYLLTQAPGREQVVAHIADNNNGALCQAAENGHIEVVKYLLTQDPGCEQVVAHIAHYSNGALRAAAQNNHIEMVKYLLTQAPGHKKVVQHIADGYNWALRAAAQNNHIEMVKYLLTQAPGHWRVMAHIADDNNRALREAASNGHIEAVKYLLTQAPGCGQVVAHITDGNNGALCQAARNGHIEAVKYLLTQAPGCEQVVAHIVYSHNEVLRCAIANGHIEVIDFLLNYPVVLSHAEMHVHEYGDVVSNKTTELLEALHTERTQFERDHPDGIFNIDDPQRAELYFYVLRNLIRTAPNGMIEKMNALLTIPSVVALLHQRIGQNGQENELLRLAQSLENAEAASRLLQFPEVRQRAEAADFYRNNAQHIDLAAIARDTESSMRALTQEEQERIETLKGHYEAGRDQSALNTFYTEQFNCLVNTLKSRYQTQPAKIEHEGTTYILPIEYTDFEEGRWHTEEGTPLQLDPQILGTLKGQALTAYFAHTDHTAFRYLSIPNPWIHPGASYVIVREDGRHADYISYKAFISLLWRAASDQKYNGILGVSTENRIALFIKELAFIGRAHNWHKRVPVMIEDTDGNLVQKINDAGEHVFLETDDGERDRPSCYSGTKKRLYQSLHQHPLYTPFDAEIVTQIIWQCAIETYTEIFEKNDGRKIAGELKSGYETLFESGETPNSNEWSDNKSLLKVGDVAKAIEATFPEKILRTLDYKSLVKQVLSNAEHVGGQVIFFWNRLEHIIGQYSEKDSSEPDSKYSSPFADRHTAINKSSVEVQFTLL